MNEVQQALNTIEEEIEATRRKAVELDGGDGGGHATARKTAVENLGWYMAGLNTAVDVLRGMTKVRTKPQPHAPATRSARVAKGLELLKTAKIIII